jgi:hypothetical protein
MSLDSEAAMSWTASQKTVCSIGVFHLLLMVGELYPWKCPLILGQVLQERQLHLLPDDESFVSTVVHNAGIYNGIVALGLIAAASYGRKAFGIQIALLAGVVVAGLFGGATLSPKTFAQAASYSAKNNP